jgi:hypothetical protein
MAAPKNRMMAMLPVTRFLLVFVVSFIVLFLWLEFLVFFEGLLTLITRQYRKRLGNEVAFFGKKRKKQRIKTMHIA